MSKIELANYRLEVAKEKLAAAKLLKSGGFFKDSISRSYYAIFSGARSLLALKEVAGEKHSGIISLFNQHYVKSGLVEKPVAKLLAGPKYFGSEIALILAHPRVIYFIIYAPSF